MNKTKAAGITILVALALIVGSQSMRSQRTVPPQGNPPRITFQEPGGYWSANRSGGDPEGFKIHRVERGDTLWDISRQYLNDPLLWPQVWDLNTQIVNPHWIYPGDQLLIKKLVVIPTPAEQPPPAEVSQVKEEEPATEPEIARKATPPVVTEAPPEPAQVKPPQPQPVASYSQMYCAGFFSETKLPPEVIVAGGEESETEQLFGDRDIIYINHGRADGIRTGDEFLVVRSIDEFSNWGREFSRAKSKSRYGYYYEDLGRVRVILAHENASTVEVQFACEEIGVGDLVVPIEHRVSPPKRAETSFDRFAAPTDAKVGTIFMSKGFHSLVGTGQIVYIDLGRKENVEVGNYFRIFRTFDGSNISVFNRSNYRKNRRTFNEVRKIVGELVVLRVEGNTSTALVTYSTQTIRLGDWLEAI